LASEANLSSALSAVQLFGGNGYMAEYGLEMQLRKRRRRHYLFRHIGHSTQSYRRDAGAVSPVRHRIREEISWTNCG
jgi:alkylation response protein AidB-like acyl-CoA dehydrogenase